MTEDLKKIFDVVSRLDSHSAFSKIYFFVRLLIVPSGKIDKLLPKKGKIIDMGCGNGPLSLYLSISSKKRQVLGLDIDEKRIKDGMKASKTLKNLSFEKKNVITDSIPRVDAVLASDFLHHIPYSSQEVVIEKISKILKAHGIFLIKEVDKGDMPRYWGSFTFDHILYPGNAIYFRSKDEWTKLLQKYGFSVTTQKTLFWFPASTVFFICKTS